jgi:hypothetical protein
VAAPAAGRAARARISGVGRRYTMELTIRIEDFRGRLPLSKRRATRPNPKNIRLMSVEIVDFVVTGERGSRDFEHHRQISD